MKNFDANAVLSIFCKNYMELKKGLPIRPSEMRVLNIITGREGPHTPVMLAELLGVSKPMITAHILPTNKALELVEYAKVELHGKLAQNRS